MIKTEKGLLNLLHVCVTLALVTELEKVKGAKKNERNLRYSL